MTLNPKQEMDALVITTAKEILIQALDSKIDVGLFAPSTDPADNLGEKYKTLVLKVAEALDSLNK